VTRACEHMERRRNVEQGLNKEYYKQINWKRNRPVVGNFVSSITNKSLVVFFIYNISNHSLSYHIFTMVSQSKSHNNNKSSCFKGKLYITLSRVEFTCSITILTIEWGKVSDTLPHVCSVRDIHAFSDFIMQM
jgi:hypothetical protein